MGWSRRLPIDCFLLLMANDHHICFLFSYQGKVKIVFQHLTTIAIAVLFFSIVQNFHTKLF